MAAASVPKPRQLAAKAFSFIPTRRGRNMSLAIIALVVIFAAGFLVGTSYQLKQQDLNLSQFWQVYSLVKNRYISEVNAEKAAEGATAGLVRSLNDPFSAFLPPSEKKSLDDELKGEFEGIGAELTEKDELITVVAPLSGSPAELSGLRANDVILKINDESAEEMTLPEAVAKIRGPKGTIVTLTVGRKGEDGPTELKITRANIIVKSVTHKMIDNVGYLEITQFGDDTVALVKQAVKDLVAKNPKAIVLDLRNNPGGYLNAVAPIAGQFIPPSVIVKETYRGGKTDEIRSTEVPVAPDVPLYVLVNGGSASASEILAGALQDYKRATLVGQKTFGKGSVQDLIPLHGDSALRLTIAEWLTPNDRQINKVGIEPDVKVEGEKTDETDPVLNKALELIKALP